MTNRIPYQHGILSQKIYCEDVKTEALAFVRGYGTLQVIWDSCYLIWDSAEQLMDPTSYENQKAVVGIGGNMIDVFGLKHQFSIQWVITNESLEDHYCVSAELLGPVNGTRHYVSKELDVYSSKSHDKAVLRKDHEDGIRKLTNSVKYLGAGTTIRRFMAWIPPADR